MAEMIYSQSGGISVDAGWYDVRFIGVEDREDMEITRGANAGKMQPRMAWVFEVVAGPKRGERICQETGTKAMARTKALVMLTGLNGGAMVIGQKVNTDVFIGRSYRIKVAPNPESDKGNLHVADIEVVNANGAPTIVRDSGGTIHQIPATPRPPAPVAPPPPPPRPTAASPPQPPIAPPAPSRVPSEPLYWISDGVKVEQMTATLVRDSHKSDPAGVDAWQYQDDKGQWQPLKGSFFLEGLAGAVMAPPAPPFPGK